MTSKLWLRAAGKRAGTQSELYLLYQELDFLMKVCSSQVVCSLSVGLLWGIIQLSYGPSLLSPHLFTP